MARLPDRKVVMAAQEEENVEVEEDSVCVYAQAQGTDGVTIPHCPLPWMGGCNLALAGREGREKRRRGYSLELKGFFFVGGGK